MIRVGKRRNHGFIQAHCPTKTQRNAAALWISLISPRFLDARSKTYSIADSLPSTATGPRTVPTVAILAKMDDTSITASD